MIGIKEENQRRADFKKLIRDLNEKDISNDTSLRNKLYVDVIRIYMGNGKEVDFRHYYSDIFATLSDIKHCGKEIELIGDNLQCLYEYAVSKKNEAMIECMRKLLDHTNLELSRINYISTIDEKIIDPNTMEQSMGDIKGIVQEQKTKVEDLLHKTENAYSNYIAILGIFSAIVIVFFSGTTILSNVISTMQNTPAEKSILICVIAGIVVFDIIFMFIYFLAKLLDRSVSATNQIIYWEKLTTRFRLRYPIVFYCNMGAGIVSIICCVIILMRKIFDIEVGEETCFSLIKNQIITLYGQHKISMMLFGILLLFDFLFAIAYIIAKVMDFNIGSTVRLRYKQGYWWRIQDDGTYSVYKVADTIKSFKSEEAAIKYIRMVTAIEAFSVHIRNFFIRGLCRYPYLSMINIVMAFLIICLK